MPTRRRQPPRSPGGEESRHAIIAAATRLFAEHGLENVTFGQIAKAAKVSRPLVYFHFTDQRTLFLACVLAARQELRDRFARQIDPADTGLDQLETMGQLYFGLHNDAPDLFRILAAFEAQPPDDGPASELSRRVEALRREIDDLKTSLVRRGIKDGSIRRDVGDPQVVGACLWGFSHGLAQLVALRGTRLSEGHKSDRRATLRTGFALLRRALAGKRG